MAVEGRARSTRRCVNMAGRGVSLLVLAALAGAELDEPTDARIATVGTTNSSLASDARDAATFLKSREKCRSLGGNFTGTSMYSGHCVFPCSNLTVFKAGMTWNISPLSWQDCHPQCEDYGAYLKDDLSWCHASTECIPGTDDFKVPKDPRTSKVTGLTGTVEYHCAGA